MRTTSRMTTVGLAAGIALFLAACSGGAASPNTTLPTNPNPPSTPAGTPTVVAVMEAEFTITLDTPVTTPGNYEFVVQNDGTIGHNLVIEGPGLSGARTSTISVGGTSTLDVTLEAGTYTLYCSVPGHRANGMQTTITVN